MQTAQSTAYSPSRNAGHVTGAGFFGRKMRNDRSRCARNFGSGQLDAGQLQAA